jgi:hypothetical protein
MAIPSDRLRKGKLPVGCGNRLSLSFHPHSRSDRRNAPAKPSRINAPSRAPIKPASVAFIMAGISSVSAAALWRLRMTGLPRMQGD